MTRPVSGTCLDHIYSNHPQRILNILTLNCGLSDHVPIFAVRKYNKEHASSSMQKNQNIRYRDMKHEKEHASSSMQKNQNIRYRDMKQFAAGLLRVNFK